MIRQKYGNADRTAIDKTSEPSRQVNDRRNLLGHNLRLRRNKNEFDLKTRMDSAAECDHNKNEMSIAISGHILRCTHQAES